MCWLSILVPKQQKTPHNTVRSVAPQVGLEPTTTRLTAECSAIELLRIIMALEKRSRLSNSLLDPGDVLLSRAVASQVPSALRGLTSVFGMGTGGSLSLLSPETLFSSSLFPRTFTTAQLKSLDTRRSALVPRTLHLSLSSD